MNETNVFKDHTKKDRHGWMLFSEDDSRTIEEKEDILIEVGSLIPVY